MLPKCLPCMEASCSGESKFLRERAEVQQPNVSNVAVIFLVLVQRDITVMMIRRVWLLLLKSGEFRVTPSLKLLNN